ncbi:FlxA-like family protein [Undibacterium sp.]|jgi:hypothetical protein|uniref:FlxA-like family protein n=1 Tax=Undibacterium sp. TaxID=1914977 RepID=UPI002B52D4A3|nr:FlxA-like family protein [Undibacterium sp.]HTD06393.1 FlxA-like family protein [Undibacterium sp.]
MVQAVGSDIGNTAGNSAASATLQAQLERYQRELSDCVNCSSAKTSEGKAQIDEISGKISSLKSRMEKVGDTKSSDTLDHAATSAGKLKDGTAISDADPTKGAPPLHNTANGGARPGAASLTVGGFLDLYA